MLDLIPTAPLMSLITYQGQDYFTSQYFHRQYLANSLHGGKHRRYDSFMRLLRSIEAYRLYLGQGDIQEVAWNKDKPHLCVYLKPLFEATGFHALTLLNATAQIAMSHHLDDELSQQMSVATNTLMARKNAHPQLDASTPTAALLAQTRLLTRAVEHLIAVEQRQDLIESRMDAIEARRPPVNRLDPIGWLRKYSKPRLERTLLKLFKAECRRLDMPVMWRPDHLDFPVPYYPEETLAAAYEASTRQIRFFEGTHDPGVGYQTRRKG